MAKNISQRFGERIRRLREKKDWTQTYLSVHTGLSRTFISDVELGRKEPCLGSIEIFALAFDLTISQLTRGL